MKIVTANGKQQVKISKKEWESIGEKQGWMKTADIGTGLPMPLYDDINTIKGQIMKWVEDYMDNYPQEQWGQMQSQIYKDLEIFCLDQARGLSVEDEPVGGGYGTPTKPDNWG